MQKENNFELAKNLIKTQNKVVLSGLSDGGQLYFLSRLPDFFVYVCSENNLQNVKYELELFGKKPCVLPYFSVGLNYSLSISNPKIYDIIQCLSKSLDNSCDCLIVSELALSMWLPKSHTFSQCSIRLNKGESFDFAKLKQQLALYQYVAVDKVENKGQFSIRGDIVDIFPSNLDNAIRICFFDDEIESIKTINLENYSSENDLEKTMIVPNTMFVLSKNEIDELAHNLQKLKNTSNNLDVNSAVKLQNNIDYCLENLQQNTFSLANLWTTPLLEQTTIFDYLNPNVVFVCENQERVFEKLNTELQNQNQKREEGFLFGECLPNAISVEQQMQTLKDNISSFKSILFEDFIIKSKRANIEFDCPPVYNYKNKKEMLVYDTMQLLDKGFKVVLFCPTEIDQVLLTELFKKQFVHFSLLQNLQSFGENNLYFFKATLPFGCIIEDEKIAFLPCGDKMINQSRAVSKQQPFFELPKAGDYVVHDFHGIGRCQGIKTMEISNFKRDYIVIEYAGTDKFYLPVENADQIAKYVGQENPKLNKIGGAEFERAQNRVREQMDLLATDMLQIYYDREHAKGFVYEVDTFVDKEFANVFPYEETPDQLKAIDDIKKDMASTKIMDRLLCGDVGYGKTEVAFRTAMTAINNGKQVVLLAPTTILTEQHYRSALSRFAGFGVKIALLNRFKTPKEVADIKTRLLSGEIDFLIGTQKVLGDDIKFKDVGLLILDEEQRLGVNDKEKIKKLKTSLDVLSMSATPIPRTLNMSLTGVRDISTIATAPNMRKSVETTVLEYSEKMVVDAIERELARGGQVLVVTDKIQGIETITGMIKRNFENAVVRYAHAQMTKNQLEDIMLNLFSGEIDVLVSTTLIENGVDLPNANTIIVLNANNFGLSQLYQLRGRVGRSDKQAFAYFCFPNLRSLSEESAKRLQAIQDFSELGSGFKIAMRDLELRGAGTILGEKQSGHLEKVGYDMYCKLLAQALEQAKGQKIGDLTSTKIDIDLNTDLPKSFVSSETQRFDVINKISKIATQKDFDETKVSLIEEYGMLPESVINLMKVAFVKNLAQDLGVEHIVIKRPQVCSLYINSNNKNCEKLVNYFERNGFYVSKLNEMTIIQDKSCKNNLQINLNQLLTFLANFVE